MKQFVLVFKILSHTYSLHQFEASPLVISSGFCHTLISPLPTARGYLDTVLLSTSSSRRARGNSTCVASLHRTSPRKTTPCGSTSWSPVTVWLHLLCLPLMDLHLLIGGGESTGFTAHLVSLKNSMSSEMSSKHAVSFGFPLVL